MNQKTASYFALLTKHNLALLALILVLTPKFMSAQTAGTLDPTFGAGGRVTTFFGGDGLNGDDAYSIAVQTNGKLVVAGITTNLDDTTDFALARYNSNGTLDATFGTGGKVKTTFADFDGVRALAVQSDGKIIAAGYTLVNFSPDFALARYNSNGTLDTTFGVGGKVITQFGGPAQAFSVAVQSDGKIVAAGFAHLVNGDFDFALTRYNSNGTLDTTFGTGGKKTTAFGVPSVAQGNAVTIQRDGKIVVGGLTIVNNIANFALARYNTNGTLDTTFGTGGKAVTDFGADDRAFSIALQADGKIVAAGMTGANFALARYNTNGTLDGTFGTGGKVTTDLAGLNDIALGVAVRSDAKIVAVGRAFVSGRPAFAVARYNSNGTLDPGFGNGGKATTSFVGSSGDQAFSVAIQPDGKAVVAGSAVVNLNTQFAIARYQ
jgi:uncharacterized delta-60 repeat protein